MSFAHELAMRYVCGTDGGENFMHETASEGGWLSSTSVDAAGGVKVGNMADAGAQESKRKTDLWKTETYVSRDSRRATGFFR